MSNIILRVARSFEPDLPELDKYIMNRLRIPTTSRKPSAGDASEATVTLSDDIVFSLTPVNAPL